MLFVVNKVIWRGIKGKAFLETIFFLGIIQTKGPSLLEYADVAKANIGLMNADQ